MRDEDGGTPDVSQNAAQLVRLLSQAEVEVAERLVQAPCRGGRGAAGGG